MEDRDDSRDWNIQSIIILLVITALPYIFCAHPYIVQLLAFAWIYYLCNAVLYTLYNT